MDHSPLTPALLEALRQWFRAQAVAYPWTLTQDPYAIWISEIMLQQTVVSAAVEPFTRWMNRWPTLNSLAQASEEQVLHAWEGLGYASRARNLHRAALQLVAEGSTTLPDAHDALRRLPGIGDYTTAAILSFAYHQPALTLDANLKRVFQRLDAEPLWSPKVEGRWRALWASLVDGFSSRETNQAVMQLGQQVCRSKGPRCEACPLQAVCQARLRGLVAQIPQPRTREVVMKETTVVLWVRKSDDNWWLSRPLAGRFSNLWLIAPWTEVTQSLPLERERLSPQVHHYTKFRDRLTSYVSNWTQQDDPPIPEGWRGRWASPREADKLGMVSVYRRLLNEAIALRV